MQNKKDSRISLVTVKSTVEISQNFVAFSVYMNFKPKYDDRFSWKLEHDLFKNPVFKPPTLAGQIICHIFPNYPEKEEFENEKGQIILTCPNLDLKPRIFEPNIFYSGKLQKNMSSYFGSID